MELQIPDGAESEEAAAIAVVVRRLVAKAKGRKDGGESVQPRDGWRFTGRIESLQSRRIKAPPGAPRDDWSSAGRTDRF